MVVAAAIHPALRPSLPALAVGPQIDTAREAGASGAGQNRRVNWTCARRLQSSSQAQPQTVHDQEKYP